ncbi:tetratricopeptide repeat protein [Nocardiopsis dassonvillei]|uniref:hypothetical protein n=1 Tax=Nocardiopsis dassonvillei TaxID=2014 RepID=UPI00363C53AB
MAKQAIDIHRRTGNRMSEFACLTSLSAAWRELGQADRSLGFIQRALELAQELEHTVREGYALLELGRTHVLLRQMEEALSCFHEAAVLHRAIADHVRGLRGGWARPTGHWSRPEKAAKFYWQAASGYRRYRDRWRLAVCLNRLASAVAASGDMETARGHWREALEALEGSTDPRAARLREEIGSRSRKTG